MMQSSVEMLPSWMRTALYATGVMNLAAALGFLPGSTGMREMAGLPTESHPLFLMTVALFVGLFGVGYLRAAMEGRAERLFIAIAALGKLGFVSLLVWYWAQDLLPLRAPMLGSADLIFSLIFFTWLLGSRASN